MKAEPMLKDRLVLSGNSFAELALWRLPRPVQGGSHAFKYRLAFVVDGICVLRYDNETGKGDHKHIGKTEYAYVLPRRNACWLISGTMLMIGEKIMNEVTIGVASRDTVSARFIEAFETGKPQTASINFENERLLWKALTLERWDILRALTGAEPMTACELAKRVDRDEKTVLADLEILFNTGFLEKTGETKFLFPYDAIHVDFVLKAA